ncbi:hypothetical protein L5515_008767 [Caenorhabditis briggsae]|uniref:Uncharacterized protein n=1 Tax=Caenorhabditis briggsae TaxID=6238 RepID=A0AAE9JN37_CAEBR|nr:hypothetical protein L5515_008767 [Caenorhabditis briggsae]
MSIQDGFMSIHGISQYIDFHFTLNYTILIPTVPFVYIIPTMVIMWKVYRGYHSQSSNLTKLTLDSHLYAMLMFYFVANISFFFTDFLRFNIPVSGLATSLCAGLFPNRYFTLLIAVGDYMNYCILILPFLVSVVRIIILSFAYNQKKIRARVMKWFILPILFLLPLFCVSFMIPSMGYCRQLGSPFGFGAIDIYYTHGWFGMSNLIPSQIMPANDSIHDLDAYKSFVPVFNFTTFQAFLPFLYICPTIVVILTILVKYKKAKAALNSATMDNNIFACIMFYFTFNMLFYFGDYFHLNLPTTGFVTSWCAGVQPNRGFTFLLMYAYYSNFGVIICPFLVCLMRLTIMMSPRQNERYCKLIMYRFAIPFLFLVPLALVAVNITTTGYCKQLNHPFSFGSIIIYEGEDYARLNTIIHFSFSSFIFSSNTTMTVFMFYKLRMTQTSSTSARTKELKRRAEFSLFLAVVSSVAPFITNSICSISFLFDRTAWDYVLFVRPIGNDFETTMMPWVLFLTHPMFRSKKKTSPVNKASVFVTSTNTSSTRIIDYSVLQAFIPILYISPTAVIMVVILVKHHYAKMMLNTVYMDTNIFIMIMFYFFFNATFFIGDYIRLNLPSSGLVTSLCAKTEPNWWYTLIIIFAYSGDYGTISCPFLTSLIRLIMILSPHNHVKYCKILMRRFVFPFIIAIPITLTLRNIPAVGYCRQMGPPFHTGAIVISEGEFYTRINVIIHISFSYITFISHVLMGVFMFFKIRKTSYNNTSNRTRELSKKAELSLTLTMASCIVPFITNSIVSFTFLLDRPNWGYVLFLRVIGNDYETIMLPWVLFFTHPLFRRKKAPRITQNQGSNIRNSNNNTPRSSSQMF